MSNGNYKNEKGLLWQASLKIRYRNEMQEAGSLERWNGGSGDYFIPENSITPQFDGVRCLLLYLIPRQLHNSLLLQQEQPQPLHHYTIFL
jgi:hypothetical protein